MRAGLYRQDQPIAVGLRPSVSSKSGTGFQVACLTFDAKRAARVSMSPPDTFGTTRYLALTKQNRAKAMRPIQIDATKTWP
jgi:hypothetical protein